MSVRGTGNFVYFTDHPLGVGASGSVYLGRHKRRGETCAVKVFRAEGGSRELVARQREFDVMQRLSHDNVIKFIAIEQESHGQDRVLVMELCTGGSVYKMLEDPENAFGFPEDEFLTFLQHITEALDYLRKSGIVHRDIKPGNILRSVKDDLRSVYKLTDFGAARELPEDGQFMSLYGTEEYLHPDVFGKALLGNAQYTTFDSSIDLWSLGVTVYHVATGKLPFQPFGGRKNKENMHRIISKKPQGCISGIQHSENGQTEWSKDLPKTNLLSRGLRRYLVHLLDKLLETNPNRRWSYETFIKASRNLTSRQIIHVFTMTTGRLDRLYVDPNELQSISHLQDSLADLTGIEASRQHLFHEVFELEDLLLGKTYVSERPPVQTTSMDTPLFVLPTKYTSDAWQLARDDLPDEPEAVSAGSQSDDSNSARNAYSCVLYIQHQAKRLRLKHSLVVRAVKYLQHLLINEIRNLQLLFEFLMSTSLHGNDSRQPEDSNMECGIQEYDSQIKHALASYVNMEKNSSVAKFLQHADNSFCNRHCRCYERSKQCSKELKVIYEDFKQTKRKDLSYNEQQIHKFDRMRIYDITMKSFQLIRSHCLPRTESLIHCFKDWYSNIFCQFREQLKNNESLLQKCQDKFVDKQIHVHVHPKKAERPIGTANPLQIATTTNPNPEPNGSPTMVLTSNPIQVSTPEKESRFPQEQRDHTNSKTYDYNYSNKAIDNVDGSSRSTYDNINDTFFQKQYVKPSSPAWISKSSPASPTNKTIPSSPTTKITSAPIQTSRPFLYSPTGTTNIRTKTFGDDDEIDFQEDPDTPEIYYSHRTIQDDSGVESLLSILNQKLEENTEIMRKTSAETSSLDRNTSNFRRRFLDEDQITLT